MARRLTALLAALLLTTGGAVAQDALDAMVGGVEALIEIPAGSFVKYEWDAERGQAVVDRFISTPVAYPANYGYLTGTLAGDGDPLDMLVYTRAPVLPGALMRVRPIGVLVMRDGGEEDDKIIAVPAGDVDPTYDALRDIADLPEVERLRLRAFFSTYKAFPEGAETVELGDFLDAEEAVRRVGAAQARFAAANPEPDRP